MTCKGGSVSSAQAMGACAYGVDSGTEEQQEHGVAGALNCLDVESGRQDSGKLRGQVCRSKSSPIWNP